MDKTYNRDIEHAARVQIVARITGYKKDTVDKVTKDVRKNDLILNTYMNLQEAQQDIENKLLEEVKNLVPFDIPNRLNTI